MHTGFITDCVSRQNTAIGRVRLPHLCVSTPRAAFELTDLGLNSCFRIISVILNYSDKLHFSNKWYRPAKRSNPETIFFRVKRAILATGVIATQHDGRMYSRIEPVDIAME